MLAVLQTRDHIVGRRVFTSRECAFYTTLVKILVNSLACTWSLLTAAAAGAGADWGTKHGNRARASSLAQNVDIQEFASGKFYL